MSGTSARVDRTSNPLDQLAINTIRTLSMDAVQAANSGHPGTPMALAPVAFCLWQRALRYDPQDPRWPNRDRFVLSAGHASMLLYSVLHLAGVRDLDEHGRVIDSPAMPLEEIKRFRQLHSRTPGHPEYRHTTGVETTTGPLGQGVANSVGMAMAARWFASTYNRPGYDLFNYRVFALAGDGCMMEGISNEAASLAGHLKLSNLCWIYDNNHITIEGATSLAFSEDVATRFLGLQWNVLRVADANDLDMIERALHVFEKTTDRPTLIILDSHIAFGAPNKQDTSAAHGEPLGEEEIRLAKRFYGWPEDAKFLVPDGVKEHFQQGLGKRGHELREGWTTLFARYQKEFPDLAKQIEQIQGRTLPAGWDQNLPTYPADPKGKATRDSGGEVLNAFAKNIPWLLGGSADLAPSTKTLLKFPGAGTFSPTESGRNLHFGVREHAMGAVLNGLAVSGLRPYGSGFLIFSDYGKNSIRLAALMRVPVIYIFTHDSIGVGEDGPTHQPIEQLMSLRAIPDMITLRPGDANEVVEAWKTILQIQDHPVALILTRQALPTFDRTKYAPASGVARGAYVLADAPGGNPEVLLLATGSEVYLCIEAHEKLLGAGIRSRVVSMPSWELFERYCAEHPEYREQVLPRSVAARVSVEQSSVVGWGDYVGLHGKRIGMTTFGASAPFKELQKVFGFTTEAIIQAAHEVLGR
ncbi:MAG: transketolase [Gemmataceae bacterium]